MAKKTKRKKTGTRRRRRIGGVNPSLMNYVYAVAGGALGQVLDQIIAHAIPADFIAKNPKALPYIKAGAPIIVGYLLPKFMKNDMGKNLGLGMIVLGGVRLLGAVGVLDALNGIQSNVDYRTSMLAAAMDTAALQYDRNYRTPMLAGYGADVGRRMAA